MTCHRLLQTASLLVPMLLVACATPPPPIKVDRQKPLEENMEAARKAMKVPGAAVGIYQGNKTLLEKGLGTADVKTGRQISATTPFRIASVSKLFVGAVTLRLDERGVVDLDDPVTKYLPDFPDGDKITLRMLGNNTSGLRNFITLPEIKKEFAENPSRVWSRQELVDVSLKAGPHFTPPGKGWMYSNTNALVLVSALEKATHKPWKTLLREEVLTPLNLRQTGIYEGTIKGQAEGYQYGDEKGPIAWKGQGTVLHNVTADSPSKWGESGNMTSTMKDLRVFMQAIEKGNYLSEGSRAEMHKFIKTGYPVDYRYGFCLSAYEDTEGHSGQVPGYQSCLAYHPETETLFVILTNVYSSPNWEEPANYLFFTAMEWLTGRSYTPEI